MIRLTSIVLTYNSAKTIECVIRALQPISSRILVVDSCGTDQTEELVRASGAEFLHHPFDNYSRQRRWAEDAAALEPGEWVLHVDSDEVISRELAESILKCISQDDPAVDGYLMQRLSYFWGKPIRHGHMNPSWHLRLYRAGRGRCEDRLYDQHFIVDGKTSKLKGKLLDLQWVDLFSWTASHNRWSSAEAQERLKPSRDGDQLHETLFGDRRMRKRWIKNRVWYRMPILARSGVFFFYSYFVKLGFLDGRTGFVYHVLHAFWFRFLTDAKLVEAKKYRDLLSAPAPRDWL